MSVKMKYKQQVDAFCNENNTLTAEEMLRIAKERMSGKEDSFGTDAELIDFAAQRQKRRTFGKILSAACIVVVCSMALATTALAATGKLGDLFRKIFKDDTSAGLVEQGYYYEVNQSDTDGVFCVDLLAVTGDADLPKLVFDVRVDDTNITTNNERVYLSAYVLGEDAYENQLENYAMFEGTGYRDSEAGNLYHVVMDGPSAWVSHGEPVVVNVREIRFEHMARWYEVNLEYRFEMPPMELHPVVSEYFGGVLISSEDDDCYLNYVNYGAYYTECIFVFDYDGVSLEGKYGTEEGLISLLQMRWLEFAADLSLVVDGTEYEIPAGETGYIWYDKDGEAGYKNRCYVRPRFDAIDYNASRHIILKQGDSEYRLK